jgi:hypothetical protein
MIWQQESKHVGVDVYNVIVILVNYVHFIWFALWKLKHNARKWNRYIISDNLDVKKPKSEIFKLHLLFFRYIQIYRCLCDNIG